MSMIYFGPYIHCNVEQVEVVVNIRCCGNIDCENVNVQIYTNAHKYCCKCGKEIHTKGVPKLQEKILKTTGEELDEIMRPLFPKFGVHLWIANMSELSYFMDSTDFIITNIMGVEYGAIINRFLNYYKNTIEQLYSLYGKTNCSTRFGLLVWSE